MTLLWKIASRVAFTLITILLLVVSFGNLMLRDDEKIPDYFVKRTGISIQTHPTLTTIVFTKKSIDLAESTKKTVDEYITTTLLSQKVSDVSADKVSPMHKIMLLMGCYGNRWDNDIAALLEQDFLLTKGKIIDADSAQDFFANFMLQALDEKSTEQVVSGEKWSSMHDTNHQLYAHDRSICNCLRDFALPLKSVTETLRYQRSRSHGTSP